MRKETLKSTREKKKENYVRKEPKKRQKEQVRVESKLSS
jgi:hypothetical protein